MINWQDYARHLQTADAIAKTLEVATVVTTVQSDLMSYTLNTFVQTASPLLPETVLAMVRADGVIIESAWGQANKPQTEAA